eukprot:SAG22_NODE_554_length_9135_cov_3.635569_4_plen_231_part_00
MWHREGGGTLAPKHPRCIQSLQVRWQFDDTDTTTTCVSTVPESVSEKKRIPSLPLLLGDGSESPIAQSQEPFINQMWRNCSADAMHLRRPGVDCVANAGDVIIIVRRSLTAHNVIMPSPLEVGLPACRCCSLTTTASLCPQNNSNIHCGTVREGKSQRVDIRIDYGPKGQTRTPLTDRVGGIQPQDGWESNFGFSRVPLRIAAAHPELIDSLPAMVLAVEQPAQAERTHS